MHNAINESKHKTLLSWSSGKDSAWALHTLRQDPQIELAGLFCTVNQAFNRVAMHGVRVKLLQRQADRLGLPLQIIIGVVMTFVLPLLFPY